MAKKFMYVCLGLMALMVAFHLGAKYGNASIVDHSTTGVIAQHGAYLLLDNGEVWDHGAPSGSWSRAPSPAVAPDEIKFWTANSFVTHSDEVWFRGSEGWVNLGPPPGLVSTQPTTWGKIKAEFGE